jgi:nucleoside-diphosphate-sugar epimerase
MKILLLGSNGFIGKHLGAHLEGSNQVTKVNRTTDLEELFNSGESFDFVINCVSSKPNSDSIESNSSNFEYPSQFLRGIKSKHWIQIESYFQLQISMGRQDFYTLDKQRFSELLDANTKNQLAPVIHHLYLPHVFGEGDRAGRLISSAKSSFIRREIFETSNGLQFLPLLHISDAVLGIGQFIENPTGEAACTPFWYGRQKDLLDLMASQFDDTRVLYGYRPDPIDASFPRVEFPKSIDGWQPKMKIDGFLDWVKVQSD